MSRSSWVVSASGRRARRIPVLFVHGQPGLGSDFDPVRERLGAEFFAVAPDRPGYGSSGMPASSMQRNVEVLAATMERTRGGPGVVVGHSYGGSLAVLLAAARPDLVAGLVLAAPVLSPDQLSSFDRVLTIPVLGDALVAAGLTAIGTVLPIARHPGLHVPGFAGEWIAASLPDGRFTRRALGRGVWRAVAREQRALVNEISDVAVSWKKLRLPADLVVGSLDLIVSPRSSAKAAAAMAGAELTIVPRTGHFLTRDAARVIAKAVSQVAGRAELTTA